MAAQDRRTRIETALRGALAPSHLEIEDESHLHRGHAGAADGRGHFRLQIVSERFAGQPRVQRHRLVYDALSAELQSDIHALAISAFTPDEWAHREG